MFSQPPSSLALPARPSPPMPAVNQHCRVVEKKVASEQVGKQAYPSFEEANIDLKVVCENP
jgi:hypothetical protein